MQSLEDLHKKFIAREKSRFNLVIDQINAKIKECENGFTRADQDIKLFETLNYQASIKEEQTVDVSTIREQSN